MAGRIKRTFSYANVVSTVALFGVMAGTSYAAVSLAADSVGSRELKNNAVTSAEVKNGSLTRSDFAAGTLLTGPRGAQGAQGAQGVPGAAACPDGLLCAGTDLPAGGYAVITIDGYELARVPAYKTNCGATTCAVAVGGPRQAGLVLDSWYDARSGPSGTKSFTLIEYSAANVPLMRFHVENGKPDSMRYQDGRFQMTFTSPLVFRTAL